MNERSNEGSTGSLLTSSPFGLEDHLRSQVSHAHSAVPVILVKFKAPSSMKKGATDRRRTNYIAFELI